MPNLRAIFIFLTALTAVSAAACSTGSAPEAGPTPAPEPAERADPDTEELDALFRARADSALMNFTDADVHFMTRMIHHHAQALDMASLAPTHGASPRIRTLAARIINAQRDEIGTMERWLRDRGRPAPDLEAAADSSDAMSIPGMLTPEQMRALGRARDREFDCLFLTSMIQHHRGAVTAVRELFATDGAARGDLTFKLASGIQVDQITEIGRMESMLEEMEGCR